MWVDYMINHVVNLGDRVDLIKLPGLEENQTTKQYLSQVLDFIDEDKAKLSMPMENNRVIPLTVGDKYEVCFYTETGLFQCKGSIIDRYKDNNLYILVIQFLSDLEKCQRRQYYRLESIIDIQYRIFSSEETILKQRLLANEFATEEMRANCEAGLEKLENQWSIATVTDISGGGIKFNSVICLEKERKIKIRLPLMLNGDKRELGLIGNVVVSAPIINRKDYFETRVEYVGISLEERETIIKYIFEQERKLLRRGLV